MSIIDLVGQNLGYVLLTVPGLIRGPALDDTIVCGFLDFAGPER